MKISIHDSNHAGQRNCNHQEKEMCHPMLSTVYHPIKTVTSESLCSMLLKAYHKIIEYNTLYKINK